MCIINAKRSCNDREPCILAFDRYSLMCVQVKEAYTPLISLQTYILQQPNFFQFQPYFEGFAQNLLEQVSW